MNANTKRCKERITYGDWGRSRQCNRAPMEGSEYCHQHSPEAVLARKREKRERWAAKHDAQMAPYRQLEQFRIERERLKFALQNANDALVDYYLVHGTNPSATYNTKQIIADARSALDKLR